MFGKQTKDMQKASSENAAYEWFLHFYSQELVPIYLLLNSLLCYKRL